MFEQPSIKQRYTDLADDLNLEPLPASILVLADVLLTKHFIDEVAGHEIAMALKNVLEESRFDVEIGSPVDVNNVGE